MGSIALISPCSPIIVVAVGSGGFGDDPPPHPINKNEINIKKIFIYPPIQF